jgi:hypothetical protein
MCVGVRTVAPAASPVRCWSRSPAPPGVGRSFGSMRVGASLWEASASGSRMRPLAPVPRRRLDLPRLCAQRARAKVNGQCRGQRPLIAPAVGNVGESAHSRERARPPPAASAAPGPRGPADVFLVVCSPGDSAGEFALVDRRSPVAQAANCEWGWIPRSAQPPADLDDLARRGAVDDQEHVGCPAQLRRSWALHGQLRPRAAGRLDSGADFASRVPGGRQIIKICGT